MKKIARIEMIGIVGIVLIITPFVNSIPLYKLLGISCGVSIVYGVICKLLIKIINLLEKKR